ncbi:hypothetical protein [Pseudomonas sp. Teo4]|uniref:hypothetical protein n=1 Tax=Pseudomonas sp. Teo4 TaxID=3064528 RepID=UPI002AB93B9F|nr:hypothetical protein [Pseudomonas sp. Teo4]MDZ3992971.1 hypothetical protein [Pseudomonas sp. Teo4]
MTNKTMSKKQLLLASIAAAVVVVGGATAMLSSSGKKAALAYYDDFKDRFFLQDVLSEGEISYSVFSGDLTVENPEIRLAAAQTNGAEKFLRGLSSMLESARGASGDEGLAGWSKYQMASTTGRGAGGVYLRAEALKLSHSGDSKDGEIRVQLLGMDQSNPYVSSKGAEVVLVADVSDEIQPRDEIGQYGDVVKSSYDWGANMAQRMPVTGAFLTAASGEFGNTVDLDLTLKRSDDGEGTMTFVVTHRNDGSKVGQIVREAHFASLPELDDVQDMLKSSLSAFIVGAYSSFTGQGVLAESVNNFARKAKLETYELTYTGFSSLKEQFEAFNTGRKAPVEAFCSQMGLSTWQSDFGAKAKKYSDSECAIVAKLATEGSVEEQYTFRPEKTLFASLFVNKGFELKTN